jgi:N-methylhydantoinase B
MTSTIDDQITSEVIRGALLVAAEEASIVVVRSAHSTFIQEGADACAAILDAECQLVALSTATSLMHAASLRCSLPALVEEFPLDTMRPGDVYALNDPYRGGIHANDVLVFRPVFADVGDEAEPWSDDRDGEAESTRTRRVAYFGGTLIHIADVGGVSAGGLAALATDTFAEGLMLPPVHLSRGGEPARDVLRIIAGNSRTPDKAIGDIHALIAGANTIGRRIEEMIEQHGADTLERFIQDWIDTTERRMRDELLRIPGGTYHGSFTIEGDGFEAGKRFHVDAAVTAADGEIEIDFTGTSDQSGGAINASFSQTMSGVIYAVRCLVDPSIPMNEGCFRAVRTVLPPGTLVNPNAPAACGGRIISVTAGIEAILGAMAQALPDHEVAASALIHVYSLTGIGDDGRPWVNLFYDFGGVGGRHGVDGPDATGCYFLGGRSVIPQVEPLEAQYPFVVHHSRLRADSGGAGQWRGGLGTELVIELQGPAELTVRGDRIELPPPGAHGGSAGKAGAYLVERADGTVEELPTKAVGIKLLAGDRFVMRTSGGGGLGSPFERDVDDVLADVVGARVTVDGAARDYGVVLDATGSAVDRDATAMLRAKLRTEPTASGEDGR